jgi:hypothetical protein
MAVRLPAWLADRIIRDSLRLAAVTSRPWLQWASLLLHYPTTTTQAFRLESTRMIEMAFAFASYNEIPGDYAEFGVYRGDTFAAAAHARRRWRRTTMRLHAFDSFEGLPPVTGSDRGGQFVDGQYAAPIAEFEHTLRRHHVDRSSVTVTRGFFADTLTAERREAIGLERCAVAWIDCDLYSSTVTALEFLTPALVDGSVLIFDDWFCYAGHPDRGEQRACAEWLRGSGRGLRLSDYERFHWAGKAFIVHAG